jgi:NAD(P)-binding Rossmann-like domain
MSTQSQPIGADQGERIAIVGGGITGLFCAYVLAKNGCQVEVFESSDQFGGRIRSFLLKRDLLNEREKSNEHTGGDPKPVKDAAGIEDFDVDAGELTGLEFCAEFGPMRVELDVQVMLKFLLDHLGIGEYPNDTTEDPFAAAHREPFPSFSSPTSADDPLYQLRPDEEGKNPLELMNLAMCRTIVHTDINTDEVSASDKQKCSDYDFKRGQLITDLTKAAAVQEPTGPIFERWARTLREDDYWVIQCYGYIKIGDVDHPVRIPLYSMGFWNLMSNYLSHNALTKVRDLGTFYHLLQENPNAADWLVWQLRQLSISGQLKGIYGGMQAITKNLLRKMGYPIAAGSPPARSVTCKVDGPRGAISIPMHLGAHVDKICHHDTGLSIELKQNPHPSRGTQYTRVILALPKAPAQGLVAASPDLKKAHNTRADKAGLPTMLDASFGFPMVKAFFVVRDRWWEEAKRANWFATRFPTREVHYWKSRDPRSRRGMVMLYTDRPASSFWANYVPAGWQNDVEELCPKQTGDNESRKVLRARLKQRLVQYINENHVPDITAEDIIWCGIMDWGRLPYGAGNHAWRPERKFWETMADLAEIAIENDQGAKLPVHVCGEAFADYHGFIEGSLRSATYTLTRILRSHQSLTTAEVLKNIFLVLDVDESKLDAALDDLPMDQAKEVQTQTNIVKTREHDYLEDLKSWVNNLDDSRQHKPPADDGSE